MTVYTIFFTPSLRAQASTALFVRLGHARWDIENYGFWELVSDWNADHVHKHDPRTIEAFTLVAFLAYNIFRNFAAPRRSPSGLPSSPPR